MTITPDGDCDMTVKGGHCVLFKEMIVSQAVVMLNATVLGLRKMD